MSIPWPRCGDETPHRAHAEPTGRECPGWTADQQLVRHLVTSVRQYVFEHYAPGPNPEGLRVEMHPSVRRALMTDLDLWERLGRETSLEDFFPVPAKVTTDLAPGQWRLVIVTEEVLLPGGKTPGS